MALPVPVGRHGHGGHGGRLDDVGGRRRLLLLLPEEEVPRGPGAQQPEQRIVEGAANFHDRIIHETIALCKLPFLDTIEYRTVRVTPSGGLSKVSLKPTVKVLKYFQC